MTPLFEPVSPELRAAFLQCHTEGHQWRPAGRLGGSEAEARPPFGMLDAVATVSQCVSCTSERFRWYTRSGELISRYRHAEGYLHKRADPDDVAPTRLEYRQRFVVTLFDEMTPRAPARARKRAAS